MYKSKYEVQRKLKQVEFAIHELNKFKNRVFIKNGIDEKTGCSPMEVRLITFIILARSIFQYAHKEACQDNNKKSFYDEFINENKIFSFFKNLRDNEIHSFSISFSAQIYALSPIESIDAETGIALGRPFNLMVEKLADIDNPKSGTSDHVKIHSQITKRVAITPALVFTLKSENKHELTEAIDKGRELFEGLEFDGISDLFELCEMYHASLVKFVDYGIAKGFIT